jgi:hypothetical protein
VADNEGREPWAHPRVKWWAWFIPTIVFLVALLVAVRNYRTYNERGAMSATPAAVQDLA